MSSPLRSFINRTVDQLRQSSQTILRASPTSPHGAVLPMVTLTSPEDLKNFVKGCDEDLGGKSTVNLDLGPEGKGRFWGRLSSELHDGRRKPGVIERGGYAGIRTKSRTTMFGSQTWDTSLHDFLRVRVRSSGDGMRYFVNIQTEGPVRSDLFQHRLWLPQLRDVDEGEGEGDGTPTPQHEWTDVVIPLAEFTLTNSGDMSEVQIPMMRSEVRTVGISVLGPKEGRYELGLESIEAITRKEAAESSARSESGASAKL